MQSYDSLITKSTPFAFVKLGDGEFMCANRSRGANCDNDPYCPILADGLINSVRYLSQLGNVYFGLWHDRSKQQFWTGLGVRQWADYHTLIIDSADLPASDALTEKLRIFRAIKESPLKKIIICNELLIKSALLFGEDKSYLVIVPFRNWVSTMFKNILSRIKDMLSDGEQHILIFSAGMGAKALIANLMRDYPNNIYLDFGSSLDYICTKRDSRGRGYTYETLQSIFKAADLLPETWDHPKYDFIYDSARRELGIHLGRA